MAAILKANPLAIREVMKMGHVHPILEEAFVEYGYMAKWEANTKAKERFSIARNMIGRGYPFEEVVSITELDPEKVRELDAPGGDAT